MHRKSAILLAACGLALATFAQDSPTERRKQDLNHFLKTFLPSRTPPTGRINAHDRTWDEWVKRTGALPPDFQSMPSISELPDPL